MVQEEIDSMERGWQTCTSSNILYCTGKMPINVSAQWMMTTCGSSAVQLMYKYLYVCGVFTVADLL
jgi:hypothetical protein